MAQNNLREICIKKKIAHDWKTKKKLKKNPQLKVEPNFFQIEFPKIKIDRRRPIHLNINFTKRNIFVSLGVMPDWILNLTSFNKLMILREKTKKNMELSWTELATSRAQLLNTTGNPCIAVNVMGYKKNRRQLVIELLKHIRNLDYKYFKIVNFSVKLKIAYGHRRLKKWPRRKRRLQRKSKGSVV